MTDPGKSLCAGEAALHFAAGEATGSHVDIGGERWYRIENADAMAPFLMSLVSDSDHWMFVSSNGALTAGRRDPDHALFPYSTDDRIHDSQDQTGGKTLLRVSRGGRTCLWEPFSQRYAGIYRIGRSVAKSVYGNKVVFEEVNHDLGLSFTAAWMTSDRFGFVRRATLVNRGEAVEVEVLDGLQNLLPAGVTRRFQLEYSTLADGYKENELELARGVGLFKLSSIPADRPEPSESLRATTVWCEGLSGARHLLCAEQVERFRRGMPVEEERLIRGRRGAYLLNAAVSLGAGESKQWSLVAECGQDASGVASLLRVLGSGGDLRSLLDEDVARGTENLVRTIASADGLQATGDSLSAWRHFSNVLFNAMRGGVPASGYTIASDDFLLFLGKASRAVCERQASFLAALPAEIAHETLLERARVQGDADLERLAHEYLPLTFSRRHGDPSRPWNIFAIEVKGPHGERLLNYQGNWRDIFQNWEALAISYPGFAESMIFKFADASTADGHNPYRVMRDGFDWEVLDPHDAWSFIGYWGDHQVAYLLKLLEVSARYHPQALRELLARRVFTYANVPYRIKPYAALLSDPRDTIDFDAALDQELHQRAAAEGSDAKALPGPDGAPYRVNFAEKLLIVVLARLFNYIPEAGLWMNTQRPEWNDANNALVGCGVSMVTLGYLRRFLHFLRSLLAGAGLAAVEVSAEVAQAFRSVAAVLDGYAPLLAGPIGDRDRKAVLDALGEAGGAYRASIYANGFSGEQAALTAAELDAFCATALAHIDHSLRANRRDDGLFHAYNLMKVEGEGIVIRRLYEMLEGQVSVLSSGALNGAESAALLDALRASRLYRENQNSYVLYPDRRLPGFFEKNNIPAEKIEESTVLREMIARGDRRIVTVDANGVAHFHADIRNGSMLRDALKPLALAGEDEAAILDLYEQVFDHQSFTGRSGTFYKYEGLGCIYWHMVSKLLLETQGALERAVRTGEDAATVERLRAHYAAIREGIGVHKPPALYGAMPTDPYSHTPSFAGVQQPGMTGQVKEDILSRFGEMGVVVEDGRLGFDRRLFRRDEFLTAPAAFRGYDLDGNETAIDLAPGTLAFTLCQVPVVAHREGPTRLEVTAKNGDRTTLETLWLDAALSASIFEREAKVRQLDVYFGQA
ncbi:MAG: hypothetical protein WCE75_15580 [Terracidiphilus sp.]